MKDKTAFQGFIEIVSESKRKSNKLWVDQLGERYNSTIQKWFGDTDTLMFLTYNEGKSIDAERFIRNWKGKIYKEITANDSKFYLEYIIIWMN